MFITNSMQTLSWVAIIAAAAQSVSAISLSSQCQTTLASLVTSGEAKCLNAQSLVALAVTGSNASVISPLNNWLTGLCAQPACTNATLAALVGNITTGCGSDLAAYGFSTNDTSEAVSLVQTAYPAARKVACLADANDGNTLCVTETLTNIQASTGTLTISKISSLVSQGAAGNVPSLPSNVTCTNCTQAAYDVVAGAFPGVLGSASSTNASANPAASQCGASFVSGAQPASITQTANNAIESKSSNGASARTAIGVALPSLLAVFCAFAVFA